MIKKILFILCFLSSPATAQQRGSQSEQRPAATEIREAAPTSDSAPTSRFRLSLKTNLPLAAAAVANLGTEFGFGRRFSLDIPVIYSPYTVRRDYQLRILGLQPELRCWLKHPMRGHFFGIHGHIGWFNVATDHQTRYQDHNNSSPLWGVGASYGYALPLSRSQSWKVEFTLGAGYANIRYDSFYNIPNGARFDTCTKHYWGVTRVGISLVYQFKIRGHR